MRTMMKAEFPVDATNRALDQIEPTLKRTFEQLKPEAAYFYSGNGTRTALWFFDMKSPSDIPVIAEPLFQQFNAKVEFFPVMNAEELREGLKRVQASV